MVRKGGTVRRGTPLPGLRRQRLAHALTQEELAKRAGVGRTTIARIEGGGKPAETRTLRKLAEALGVEPRALLKDTQ
jgi:transcriptional regulator with XRE-family HTH domain